MFHGLMQEIVDGITEFKSFSIQAVQGETRVFLYLRGWKANSPFNVCFGTYDRFAKFPLGELTSLAGLLSCFPSPVHSLAVIDFPPHFGKALDHATSAPTSTICVPSLSFKELSNVLRTPTSSIFGKADLFGLIDYLMVSMRSAVTEPWVLDSVHLRIVSC